MRIARVFPRRTHATPIDDMAFVGSPGLFPLDADEVHISVAFTWDIPEAQRLEREWRHIAPVKIGGAAYGNPGSEFIPGMYMKPGYVITSRGCPNRCWYCPAWKNEGQTIRELPIHNGHIIQDNNLLACSETHIRTVFRMLKRQKEKAQFSGRLEAARLQDWHISLLADLRPAQIFLAYDTPDDFEPLTVASRKLKAAGFTRHQLRATVLIGWPTDTFAGAEARLKAVMSLGIYPFAMLWRRKDGKRKRDWMRFQKSWARPAAIYGRQIRGLI